MHNCNRKIHQHNCNRKDRLRTCKNATDVVTCIIAIESAGCIVSTESATCRIDYRNFHLQKWCQSEILLVTIKKLSKIVSTNFKASLFWYSLYNLMERNLTLHCINELCYILIILIFNFLIFIHFTNQKTLKPNLAQKLKLIFKFSTIMRHINVPLWTHIGHKG